MTTARGRPPGRVGDLPAPPGQEFHADARTGWLLRSWRLTEPGLAHAHAMAAALRATGVPADVSRISRWETGHLQVPPTVLAAYEDLLRRPPGGLAAMASFLRRQAGGPAAPNGPTVSGQRLQAVLDRVVDDCPSGRDWLDLGLAAAAVGERLVLPRSVWTGLATRLVAEMSRSITNAYLAREEAVILLAEHPAARRAVVDAVSMAVGEPDSMLVTDPMSLLQDVSGPEAEDLVLRLLEDPSRVTRNTAAWTAAAKVEHGHFSAAGLRRLEEVLRRLVDGGVGGQPEVSRVADVVAALPADARDRLQAVTPVAATTPGDGGSGLDPPAGAAELAARLGRADRDLLRSDDDADDPVLRALASEALTHSSADRRFTAAFLITMSPYAAGVAARAAGWLEREVLEGGVPVDAELLRRVLVLMSLLADLPQAPTLCRVLTAGPPEQRPLTLTVLAHLPAPAVAEAAVAELVGGQDEPVARAALYYAGMHASPVLARVAADAAVPDRRRRGARWWQGHGGALREPAR